MKDQHKTLFEMEEDVLEFWKENDIYAKSLSKNPTDKVFSFYDGPPFITGSPHYATLLPSIAKDIIPRYQTMRGKYVRRIWGWDVHGLPAENQVEKKLGLKGKKDIETLGIDKFVEACRQYVAEVSDVWKWYVDHIGRWADMDKAYRTDQLSYMESVMWLFKELYDKGLIYRGRRTSLYCPRCATPLSKFEITMDEGNYRDVSDPGVTILFKVIGQPDTYLAAWTTTPWTLPANLALAIDPEAEYVRTTDGKRTIIMAHQALERYREFDLEIEETCKGKDLTGLGYEPLYHFLPTDERSDYRVYPADFVSMEDGTGIVHIAPGFGEDDTKLGEKVGLSLLETLDPEGKFITEIGEWGGIYYKKADPLIMEDLNKRGQLLKEESITHSYPHCYRCGTPLIYKAQVSWYLRLEPIRQLLLVNNKSINWVPAHFGRGRFVHNLETAPDWSLSRTRYWGSPIPVWETEDGEMIVVGSIKELEELSGQKVTDLHRPNIDDIVVTTKSGKKARRVKEVLDCWFESGAMPFAQDHYPFENQKVFEQHFPADFIIEYTGQLRGWFYYLHVLSNALKSENSFKNVVVTGVMMGSDGKKMSKSAGNYPDPKGTIEKYGAEALRLYFMSSRIMNGEDLSISEEDIREQARLLNILHNSFRYYQTYAKLHNFKPAANVKPLHLLDRWIVTRLNQFVAEYSQGLDDFDLPASTKAIRPFIEDLSTWYIRRSRDRFVEGNKEALQTLHNVLLSFAKAAAPTLPFSAEMIFSVLKIESDPESVHLCDYPSFDEVLVSEQGGSLALMEQVRTVASAVHMLRAQSGLSLRQPLAAIAIKGLTDLSNEPEFVETLREEVNVEAVLFEAKNLRGWPSVELGEKRIVYLETKLTDELVEEGKFRDLVRSLQEARKKAGLKVGQQAVLHYQADDKSYADMFKKRSSDLKKSVGLSEIKPSKMNLDQLDKLPLKIRLEA